MSKWPVSQNSYGSTTCASTGNPRRRKLYRSSVSRWLTVTSTMDLNTWEWERSSSRLLSQTDVTLPWLKLYIGDWEGLLSDQPALEKQSQLRLLALNSVDSYWSSTAMRHSMAMPCLESSLDFAKSEPGDASMSSTDLKKECCLQCLSQSWLFNLD